MVLNKYMPMAENFGKRTESISSGLDLSPPVIQIYRQIKFLHWSPDLERISKPNFDTSTYCHVEHIATSPIFWSEYCTFPVDCKYESAFACVKPFFVQDRPKTLNSGHAQVTTNIDLLKLSMTLQRTALKNVLDKKIPEAEATTHSGGPSDVDDSQINKENWYNKAICRPF